MTAAIRPSPTAFYYNLAKSKGGECLSTEYINAHRKLLWKCKNKNGWCPQCKKNEKYKS